MEFKCHIDEQDYTNMIANALKLQTIRIILAIEEIADVEKVLILKDLLHVEPKRVDGTDEEMDWNEYDDLK